ncbi:hypothetical protein CPAST_c06080 [Clostridium pasteurianum DSM 525 = ATCC 6013]|uniref:Acyltransferase 3 n=1 Tax=Clostridium pasteurianum DSM 525 = ATCC 6013 TaxID=1262449 RepID=A0A0H3J470_CLOPA|nr:acyltransferase family protein [Clostridium pasteurianum]AJA46708.1 hypothetical protein CPAST_c06080 [Clostridium pasteurianum DSM 525 = ATCC 6013]AJA50696.1 hypothetical protein CLPA_c06080 [Clostridium pasteurianum DSM 525 = ATCC 6013]AOZ74112.1 hypothetical protein AQ983_02925 [Clostridium pasteurianum DSM 525 = ATCC 6013]AOZ77909.1 hypothetical protein AQ984_02925 [Clostridium pasteurianum]ELP61275.1 hypothetical protein F502_02430 [Clostridium pasteurianum DSM 525 = ATCC 6013]
MIYEKQRDYYFDNLKLILITLVVMGHVVEPLIGNYPKAKLLYSFIYSFHMPLFAFISGYFSKNNGSHKNIIYKINTILIPYIIFQLLYSLFNIYILKAENFPITLVYPYWITWYLLSLLLWNIVLPYFSKLRFSIIIAVIISLMAGYDNNIGYYLSLSRTITFFPYFLMGYFFKREYIIVLKHYISKPLSLVILLMSMLPISFILYRIDYRWFYGSFSYAQINSTGLPGFLMKIFTYILAIFICTFILVLIPNSNLFFTNLGSRTMAVYLFHGFIVKLFVKYNILRMLIKDNAFINETLIISLSLIIVFVLSSKIITKITKSIVMTKLLRY